jgi:hypothetical protein
MNEPMPAADIEEAIHFLKWLDPQGPWHVYSIDSENGGAPVPMPYDFGPTSNLEQGRAWIVSKNAVRQNIYYSPNRPNAGLRKKASKDEMGLALWAYVDIDPRVGEDVEVEQSRILGLLRDRLPSEVPEPSGIVFSGGGYQVLWRLDRALSLADSAAVGEYEALNRGLEYLLTGDRCHNCDRILRLPGTVNWPNLQKREKGRKPALAHIVGQLSDAAVKPEDLPKGADPMKPASRSAAPVAELEASQLADLNDLDRWHVPERVKAIIHTGPDAEQPKKGDNSRSGWLFDVTCQLVRTGVPDEVILGILLDRRWAVSRSVLEKRHGAEKYARRQVQRAREIAELDAAEFDKDEKGRVLKDQRNIRLALHKLGISLAYNTFHDRVILAGLEGFGPIVDDAAMIRMRLSVEDKFGLLPSKEFFEDVVKDTARANSFHPVRDYLDGLVWDETPRIDKWLTAYAGVKDTAYTNAVGALWLIAAVRRARHPGCKFDEMIVFESEQGKDKSTALSILAVEEDWFTDNLPLNADAARTIECLAGRWIIEAAELQGMRKGDVEHLKALLSRRVDRARLAYGRLPAEFPRQCVFAGTTNNQKYLRDQTGNRRFWPIKVGTMAVADLLRDRDQLWAEAAHREAQGASIRLDSTLWQEAAVEQDERREEDPFTIMLAEKLTACTGKIKVTDVFELLGIPPQMRTQDQNTRVGNSMRMLGWEHVQRRFGGDPEWSYVKGTQQERQRKLTVICVEGRTFVNNGPVDAPNKLPF